MMTLKKIIPHIKPLFKLWLKMSVVIACVALWVAVTLGGTMAFYKNGYPVLAVIFPCFTTSVYITGLMYWTRQ